MKRRAHKNIDDLYRRILELLPVDRSMQVPEISRRLRQPKKRIQSCLQALYRQCLVARAGRGRYLLGPEPP